MDLLVGSTIQYPCSLQAFKIRTVGLEQGAVDVTLAHVYSSWTKTFMNIFADTDEMYDMLKRTFRCVGRSPKA